MELHCFDRNWFHPEASVLPGVADVSWFSRRILAHDSQSFVCPEQYFFLQEFLGVGSDIFKVTVTPELNWAGNVRYNGKSPAWGLEYGTAKPRDGKYKTWKDCHRVGCVISYLTDDRNECVYGLHQGNTRLSIMVIAEDRSGLELLKFISLWEPVVYPPLHTLRSETSLGRWTAVSARGLVYSVALHPLNMLPSPTLDVAVYDVAKQPAAEFHRGQQIACFAQSPNYLGAGSQMQNLMVVCPQLVGGRHIFFLSARTELCNNAVFYQLVRT
jgi:hypothetical protein